MDLMKIMLKISPIFIILLYIYIEITVTNNNSKAGLSVFQVVTTVFETLFLCTLEL